jgi:hypothetical protein
VGSSFGHLPPASADLPIIRTTKFVLPINLKTPKALDLTIPSDVLALADEVIDRWREFIAGSVARRMAARVVSGGAASPGDRVS